MSKASLLLGLLTFARFADGAASHALDGKPLDEVLAIAAEAAHTAGQVAPLPAKRYEEAVRRLTDWQPTSPAEEAKIAATLTEVAFAPASGQRPARHALQWLRTHGHEEILSRVFAELEENPWRFEAYFQGPADEGISPPVEMLRAGLLCKNSRSRDCVLNVIGRYKVFALRMEVERVMIDDPTGWWEASAALRQMRCTESAPALQRAIEKDSRCRRPALYALAAVGGDAQVPTIVASLDDSHPETRETALQALAYVKVKNPAPVVTALLHVLNDSPDAPPLLAACALAGYKDARALPFLRRIAERPGGEFDSERKCVQAIANVGGPDALALFHEMVTNRWCSRGGVEDELVKLADPSSGPVVWAAYLKQPVRQVISGWCATTGGYTEGLNVLRVCADRELLQRIRDRAAETTDSTEKRILAHLVTAIEERLSGHRGRG